jgi:Spy/CpxP family protein refolding chaperone
MIGFMAWAAVICTGTAIAAGPAPGAGMMPEIPAHAGMGRSSWMDTVTDDQRAEIDLSHLRLRQKQALLDAQIGLKRAEINRMITSEEGDQDTLQVRLDELAALEKDKLSSYYRHIMEVRQLLTPKQRVAFDLDLLSPHRGDGPEAHPH